MKKKIFIVVIILVITATIAILGWQRYEKLQIQEKNAETIIPNLNTVSLVDGYKDLSYSENIIASITGGHGDIEIVAKNLPKGLFVESCKQVNDSNLVDKPNTVKICSLSGTPEEVGVYEVKINVKVSNFYNSTSYTLPLNINNSDIEN